jgi:hypothetical protein
MNVGLTEKQKRIIVPNQRRRWTRPPRVRDFYRAQEAENLNIFQISISGLAAAFGEIQRSPEHLLSMFRQLRAPPADLLVFLIGTNDCRVVHQMNQDVAKNPSLSDAEKQMRIISPADLFFEISGFISRARDVLCPSGIALWLGPGSNAPAPGSEGHVCCEYGDLVKALRVQAKRRAKDGFLCSDNYNVHYWSLHHVPHEGILDKWNHLHSRVHEAVAIDLFNKCQAYQCLARIL